MSTGELLLIFLVTLLVFGPSKLPMLAQHLGKLISQINHYKHQVMTFWQTQLQQQQLQDSLQKAQKADKLYQQKNTTAEENE